MPKPTLQETRDKFQRGAQRQAAKWLIRFDVDIAEAVNDWIHLHNLDVPDVLTEYDEVYGKTSSRDTRKQVELAAQWATRERDG